MSTETTQRTGFRGHRPSGNASWPTVLVAGAEKTGKSYLVAELSGSDLIGDTFWIEYGETTAEQYGDVPGARYIVADHDGTFDDLCRRAREAVAEPMVDGKPNLIVIDSVTLIWETLSAEAQQIANRRKKTDIDAESKITSDIWNLVTERWKKLLRILRSHNGPVVLVARLEVVAVMDAAGQPTKEKTQKVKAQKSLPYDVDVIVQIPEYRRFQLTGVRSLKLQMPPGEKFDVPSDFTLDGLMRNLGLPNDVPVGPRVFTEPVPDADGALADAGRPAQRHRGPVEDEWNTASGQPLPPPSPVMPSPTGDEITEMVRLLGVKRSVYNGDCARVVSELVRRRIDDPRTLSQAEARSIIETLTAEPDLVQLPTTPTPAPVPAGPPMRMATEAQKKMMWATINEQGHTHDGGHVLMSRILRRKITTTNQLTFEDASTVINALGTGEIPPPFEPAPAGPNANGEGISVVDVLRQIIDDAHTPDEFEQARADIEREHAEGGISGEQLAALQAQWIDRRNEQQAKVGASA